MKKTWKKWLALFLVISMFAAPVALAGDNSITGKVLKTDKGVVITADSGDTYQVMGKDLSQMIGQTVKATGTLTEGDSGKVITIISIEPVKK